MIRTPGLIIPSSYSSNEDLERDLKRRDKDAGYTTLSIEELNHASQGGLFVITDENVEDFLEHFGVKGMKWGVRRKSGYTPKTAEQKTRRRKQIKVGVAVVGVASVAIGAVIARDMMKQYGGVKIKSMPKAYNVDRFPSSEERRAFTKSILDKNKVGFGGTRPRVPSNASNVARTSSGAIPMHAARILQATGKTRIKDIPKTTKIPSELLPRVNAARNHLKNAPTAASLGLWKPNV